MSYIMRHGLKLTFANILGFLLSIVIHIMGIIIGLIFLAIFSLGAIGFSTLGSDGFENPIRALENLDGASLGLVISLVIGYILYYVISILISLVGNAILMGGTYGSSIETVFNNRSSFRYYFSSAFRYIWKLTGLQLAFFLIVLPVYILLIIVLIAGNSASPSEEPVFLLITVVLFLITLFLFSILFLHSPILIMKEKAKIWQSISLSWRLTRKSFGNVFLSSIIFNGIFIALFAALTGVFFIFATLFGVDFDQFGDSVIGIILLVLFALFGIFVAFPYAYTIAHLILVDRYKRKLRHFINPTDGDHPPNGNPLVEPNFTFHPPSNPLTGNADRPPSFDL